MEQGDLAVRRAERLRAVRTDVVSRWLDRISARVTLEPDHVFPADQLLNHVPLLVDGIANYLERGESLWGARALGSASSRTRSRPLADASGPNFRRRAIAYSASHCRRGGRRMLRPPAPIAIKGRSIQRRAGRMRKQQTIDQYSSHRTDIGS
jgi:hypothetical protein